MLNCHSLYQEAILIQLKNAEFSVGVAHWIGHVVYGFLVGLVYGLMGL